MADNNKAVNNYRERRCVQEKVHLSKQELQIELVRRCRRMVVRQAMTAPMVRVTMTQLTQTRMLRTAQEKVTMKNRKMRC